MKKHIFYISLLLFLPSKATYSQCFSVVKSGENHLIAQKPDNSIWSWGWGIWGALGQNSELDVLTPTQIGTATNWQYIFPGSYNTFVIKSNGTLWATGGGDYGELGDGGSGLGHELFQLTEIGTDTNWKFISSDFGFTIGLKTDGTIWSCGINTFNQLGDNGPNRSVFTQIGSANNWKSITTGSGFALALKNDGTMWGWGSNGSGCLGIGSLEIQGVSAPVQSGTDNDWKVVVSGHHAGHSLAIKNNGTLYSFGGMWSDGMGGLGFGLNTIPSISPTQIGTDNDWKSVSVGHNNSFGIKTNGTLWAWGQNNYGQLGDGTTADKGFPVQIGIDTDWASVSPGTSHTVALKTNGSLWFWGDGEFGQQGNGAYGGSIIPVQVNVSGCALATESFAGKDSNITVSPNPAKDIINISNNKNVKFNSIEIFDFTGRIVFKNTLKNESINYSVIINDLSTGVYSIIFKNNVDIVDVKKLIKE